MTVADTLSVVSQPDVVTLRVPRDLAWILFPIVTAGTYMVVSEGVAWLSIPLRWLARKLA